MFSWRPHDRLRVSAGDCLVFEDADLGVEAAARAEMKCVDVRTFYTPRRMSVCRQMIRWRGLFFVLAIIVFAVA